MAVKIEKGMVGVVAYTLRDDAGKVLDRSGPGQPLAYLHGHANIVSGLEKALEGLSAGDERAVRVSPTDGYGDRTGEPQLVPKREFPRDVELHEGMPLRMKGSDGEEVVVWVHEVRGSRVALHTDHPYAGMVLNFEIEVLSVREATADEITHGHAHGPDGNPHH